VSSALQHASVDCVLVVYGATLAPRPADVARAVVSASSTVPDKTVVASFPGQGLPGTLVPAGSRAVPNIGFPDAAARALAKVAEHGEWRRRPAGEVAVPEGVDLDRARAVVDAALRERRRWLRTDEVTALLGAAGLAVARQEVVTDAGGAVEAAARIEGAVALKAVGRQRGAKTEAAGVALDLHGDDDVRRAHERMARQLGAAMDEAVVQAMVPPGQDVSVTLAPAPIVGAALGIGPGGALGGLLGPTARTVLPLTDTAASEAVTRSGLRGALGPDGVVALCDVLARVAHLAEEVPEVVELTLNPVIIGRGTAWCTDASVAVEPFDPGPPPGARRVG
jgi:acyl-CoA synthetase (NDP forming)